MPQDREFRRDRAADEGHRLLGTKRRGQGLEFSPHATPGIGRQCLNPSRRSMRTVGDRESVIHEQVRVPCRRRRASGRLPPHPRESASSRAKRSPVRQGINRVFGGVPIQSSANVTARPPKAVDKVSATASSTPV